MPFRFVAFPFGRHRPGGQPASRILASHSKCSAFLLIPGLTAVTVNMMKETSAAQILANGQLHPRLHPHHITQARFFNK
jgi:hypothetical protein